MAKTPSLKQQLIQELANQTVAQLTQPQNNDVAQLQAQYDSWVQEQEVASLQAQYDEWLKAQTPQEVPQAAPQVAPQVQAPQVQAPIAEKPSAPKRSLRLEQEEAKMLAKEAQQKQNVLNDVNTLRQNRLSDFAKMGLGEGRKKPAPRQPSEEPYMRQEITPEELNYAGWKKPGEIKQELTLTEDNTPAQVSVPDELIAQYAEKNGISFDDAKAAIAKAESMRNQSITAPGNIDADTTDALHNAYMEQTEKNNQYQYTPYQSFLSGTGKALTDVVNGPVYLAGQVTGQGWDLYSDRQRQAAKNAAEQHPTANNFGTMAGMALGAYSLGGGMGGRALTQAGGTTAGEAFTGAYGDAMLNGASKADAVLNGIGSAARTMGGNALKDMPLDLATDILPTLANDIAEGKSTGEIIKKTAGNVGLNGVFNTLGDIASMYKPLKAIGRTATGTLPEVDLPIKEVGKQIVPGMETAEDVTKSINSQFSDLMKNYQPETSSMKNIYSVDDLDNAMNRQLSQAISENTAHVKHDLPTTPEPDGFIPTRYSESNGVLPYNSHEISNLSSGNRNVINNGNNFGDFVKRSIEQKGANHEKFYFGKVSEELNRDIKNAVGLDADDYDIIMDSSHVWHDYKEHGLKQKSEIDQGQVPVTQSTISELQKVFDNPDTITKRPGVDSSGHEVIRIGKRVDGHWYVTEGYADNKHALIIDSFIIRKTPLEADSANMPLSLRPKPNNQSESLLSDSNITDAIKKVNKNSVKNAEAPTVKPEIEEIDGVRQYVKNPNISSEANQRINSDLYMLEEAANNIPLTEQLGKLSEDNQRLMMDYLDYGSQLRRGVDPENAKAKMAEIAEQIKSADKADKAIMKDLKDWDDVLNSIENYKAALNGDDRKAVEDAAKALDAARNRLARRKATDPNIKAAFGKQFGPVINRPKSLYAAAGENLDVSEIDNIAENVTKQAPEVVENATKNTVEGADPMQYFAGGDTEGQWKTSKYRTNTAENSGKIKNAGDMPMRDYAYRVFGEEAQKKAYYERYADVDDVVNELLFKDHGDFDEVDVKGAQMEWNRLMDSNDPKDIRKANRLGKVIAYETREGGRMPQALAEFNRSTPEGQVRVAQQALDKLTDKRVGAGTSEALDNIVEKIEKAYDKYGGDKEAFSSEIEKIFEGDIRRNVNGKVAQKMQPRSVKGKNRILKMIRDGASIDDITNVVYKMNGGAKLTAEENKQIYDLLKKAAGMQESYEQEELLAKAAKIVMGRVPSTLGQKVRAVLYANMLGNFKTAISRNFFGNAAYQTLEQGRQPIAAAIDKLVSLKTKQHSTLGWNKDKAKSFASGFKKGGLEQLADMKRGIATGRSGEKGWEAALKNNTTTFDNSKKAGELANNVEYYVTSAMKLGDRPWYEANYNQAVTELHQLIDRYGKEGVAGLGGIKDEDIDDVIDMIASVRAADSVFQKQGKMAKGLTDLRNGLGSMSEGALGVDILSTASSPFTLTPGNMLERAVEYTPLGFVKNAVETGKEILGKKGFNQRRFVDEASRSVAGLPILGGAYALAKSRDSDGEAGEWVREHLGSINGGYSEDPDEKQAQIDDGFIEYGYNVPQWVPRYGGRTLDTSDLPVIGPFMQAGAVAAKEGFSPETSLQAAEAVLGGSATQGIRKTFGADTPSYSSQNGVVQNLVDTVKSSGTQLVPSLMRQTAQTMDKYKRDLGEYGTNEYYLNSIKNSTPILRQTLPIKTDTEGEKVLQNQGRSLGEKILENYLLPMNVGEYQPSELNQEAKRIYDSAGTAMAFVPKAKRADLRKWDDNAQKEYTEEQFRAYKEDFGKLNSEAGHAIIESDFYQNLSDGTKAKALSDAYSAMKQIARYNATGVEIDDKIAKAYQNDGGMDGMLNYIAGKYAAKDADVTAGSAAGKAIQKMAEDGNVEEAYDMSDQVKLLPGLGLELPGPKATYTKAYEVYGGMSAEEFADIYNDIDLDHSQGLKKKEEVLPYMNKMHFSYDEGMKFWNAFGKETWKIPSLKDGVWK